MTPFNIDITLNILHAWLNIVFITLRNNYAVLNNRHYTTIIMDTLRSHLRLIQSEIIADVIRNYRRISQDII